MAENLLKSNYINQEVLHTKSAFLTNRTFNLDIEGATLDVDSAIASAEARERQFYARFKQNNYDDFMRLVRTEFINNEKDKEVLSRFTFDNLCTTLWALSKQQQKQFHKPEEFEFKLTIKNDAPAEIHKAVSKIFGGKQGDELADALSKISIDSQELYQLINKATGHSRKVKGMTASKVKSDRLQEIKQLEKEMQKDTSWLSFGIKKGDEEYTLSKIIEEDQMEAAFPWGFKTEHIKQMSSSPEMREKLNKAFLIVKDYVLRTLGKDASPQLKRALQITWDEKVGPYLNEDFTFFERGVASNSIKGAFGEFQAAAIMELFNIIYGASNSKSIAKIAGDTDSTAGLADVNVFGNFGIQVKNFSERKKDTTIGATTNIGLLTKYFTNEQVAKDTRIFFANYFFNKSFQSEMGNIANQLSEDISTLHYALLSLSTSDDQRVSFYTISGKYFVPASEILRAIKNGQSKFALKSKPNYRGSLGKTDEGFKNKNLYKNYWIPNETNGRVYYTPTEQNKASYDNLVNNAITIKSGFSYEFILKEVSNARYDLY